MISTLQALIAFLDDNTVNSALFEKVENRIYGKMLPTFPGGKTVFSGDDPSGYSAAAHGGLNWNQLPAIRILPTAGDTEIRGLILAREFKVQVYAERDEVLAETAYRVLFDALHNVKNNSTFNIRHAMLVGGESWLTDPNTKWTFMDADFEVNFFNS